MNAAHVSGVGHRHWSECTVVHVCIVQCTVQGGACMVVVEVEVAQQGVACKVGREAGHAGMWPGRQNTPGAATLTCTPQLPAARTPPVHSTHA